MAPVIYVDLLNLACCAIEAARGLELWLEEVDQAGEFTASYSGSTGFLSGLVSELGEPLTNSPELSILVVAGTVTQAQGELVRQRFEALQQPRAVVALGVCTISGGPYWDSYSVLPGIADLVPVAVMVPGCPPLPEDVGIALDQVVSQHLRRNEPTLTRSGG